jgi:sulfoxide reductase heme-binding subunit YedZ
VKADWYLTRATGAMALVLLTLVLAFGVAQVGRLRSTRWPRFVLDGLHRFLALLAILLLTVHILSAVIDSYAPIALLDAVVPFIGAYRPLWLGFGAAALDLLLAVAMTSALRGRLGHRSWRAVHWLAYAVWPLALLHGLGTGSDVRAGWLEGLAVGCTVIVLLTVLSRIALGWPRQRSLGALAALATTGFTLGVIVWLPGGPLAHDWARRAGTPARLLGGAPARAAGRR